MIWTNVLIICLNAYTPNASATARLQDTDTGLPLNILAPAKQVIMPIGQHKIVNNKLWPELNKIVVWLCGWEVLEVVVEGAVGDVGGEGREGFLRGERAGVGEAGSWRRRVRVPWGPGSGA